MEPFVVTTIVLASILLLVGVGYIIMAIKLKTIRQKKKAKEVKTEPEPVQPVQSVSVPEDVDLCDMLDKYSKSASKDFERNEKACRKVIKDLEAKVYSRKKDILEIMETFCKLDNMTRTNSGQSLKTKIKITNFLETIASRRYYSKRLYAFVSGEGYMKISDKVKLPNDNIQDIYVELEPNCYQKMI